MITDKVRVRRVLEGRTVEDVGVVKDQDLKFEEIQVSHTLGRV